MKRPARNPYGPAAYLPAALAAISTAGAVVGYIRGPIWQGIGWTIAALAWVGSGLYIRYRRRRPVVLTIWIETVKEQEHDQAHDHH